MNFLYVYFSSISRALCSDGMRCIKPLAPSRNETNSSRVNVGADGTILRICADGGHDQAGLFAEQPGDSKANALSLPPTSPQDSFSAVVGVSDSRAKTHQWAALSHGRGGGRLFGSGTGLEIAVSKMAT
jgi:hypothetical protein